MTRVPTVLHVVESVTYGVARHLVDLTAAPSLRHVVAGPRQRDRRGGEPDEALWRAVHRQGATFRELPMTRAPFSSTNREARRIFQELVADVNPDVVHAHSSIAGVVARTTTAWRGTPIIYSPHGVADSPAQALIERRLRARTRAYVAVSPSERRLLRERWRIEPSRIVVIPNAVAVPASPATKADAGSLLFVGRLSREKGAELLLRALSEVLDRSWTLDVVGDGPEARRLRSLARRLGLDGRVRFRGWVPNARAAMPGYDAIIVPSAREGSPYVVLEAMAAGLLVIATEAPGVADVVEDGRNGLLVARTPTALARAIRGYLDAPASYSDLRAQAREGVRRQHDLCGMHDRYLQLYSAHGRDHAAPTP